MKKFLSWVCAIAALLVLGWLAGPRLLVADGDLAEPRSEVYAAELDGSIYTVGGIGFFRTLDSCARFDTAERIWHDCPNLPRALHHVAMAAENDVAGGGRVFASGGYSQLPFEIDTAGAVFVLEPGADAWREFARLPHPLGQHTMAYHGGALWLVGGDKSGETVADLWRLDLASGAWQQMAPMAIARHSHAATQDSEALYVSGGRSAALGTQSQSVERYDFATNSWTRLPDLPEPLAGHGMAIIGGTLHSFGGENLDEGTVHDRHDVLDLASGVWRAGPPLPEGRHGFASAEVDGVIWVLAGGRWHGMWTPLSVSGTALPVSPQ